MHKHITVVFPNQDICQVRGDLKHVQSRDRQAAVFSFDGVKVEEGERFLAILDPVDDRMKVNTNYCSTLTLAASQYLLMHLLRSALYECDCPLLMKEANEAFKRQY